MSAGLEEGLSSMVKGERAVISCPAEYASNSTLLPQPPDQLDRVEFELHLISLAQVCSSSMHTDMVAEVQHMPLHASLQATPTYYSN